MKMYRFKNATNLRDFVEYGSASGDLILAQTLDLFPFELVEYTREQIESVRIHRPDGKTAILHAEDLDQSYLLSFAELEIYFESVPANEIEKEKRVAFLEKQIARLQEELNELNAEI